MKFNWQAEGCTNHYPEWELWFTLGVLGFLMIFLGMALQGYLDTKRHNK